jgi:hypothetical protein
LLSSWADRIITVQSSPSHLGGGENFLSPMFS